MSPLRAAAIVDGFNLYHSIQDALNNIRLANDANRQSGKPLQSEQMRWLDVRGMIGSYTSALRERFGQAVELDAVHYFSAFARHRGIDTVHRHMDFVSGLVMYGVSVEMASFKRRDASCPECRQTFSYHTEKESDVAVASKLLEVAATRAADVALVVSGDTDLIPAFRTARRLNPQVRLVSLFPYNRESASLRLLADTSHVLNTKTYRKWQMRDPIELPNGDLLSRPSGW